MERSIGTDMSADQRVVRNDTDRGRAVYRAHHEGVPCEACRWACLAVSPSSSKHAKQNGFGLSPRSR